MKRLAALATVFPMLAVAGLAQEAGSGDEARVLKAAAELMRATDYCALVTLDRDGTPQARAMQPFPPEPDLSVWFGTHVGTRKLEQIRKDPRVTLFYLASDGSGYVTLIGRAEIVTDPAEKAKRWMPSWQAFYEDANRGQDYVLIRVSPARVEMMSFPHGIAIDPKGWKPAIVELP
jgi:PPOX class probable F420-dependent enzyme